METIEELEKRIAESKALLQTLPEDARHREKIIWRIEQDETQLARIKKQHEI